MRLTADQETVLSVALQGHNLVISGQAGTGKSFLVSSILRRFRERRKSVSVICSSGLACTVYDRGVSAKTVHSYYGLGTANSPWQKIVNVCKSNSMVISRLRSSDVVIWDEISMSSARILELVNVIEIAVSQGQSCSRPFGGKQVILVGDFLQLKPVPNTFDGGLYCFCSDIFKLSFPHRYELTTLVRQRAEETPFLEALRDVRVGHCSQGTQDFLSTLSRNLSEPLCSVATHIFFLRLNTALYNLTVMRYMPGEFMEFNADVNGEQPGTSFCPAEKVLRLKVGCKVMLLWNQSDSLRNGSQGTFEGLDDSGNALVRFASDGLVTISRRSWSKVDRNGCMVGSMTQFPLIASYAITCHKSQGQTLPAAVVHCSNEFVSGLTYVAMSRVKSSDHLQLINFQQKLLTNVPQAVSNEDWTTTDDNLLPDFSCCRGQCLSDPKYFQASDRKSTVENTGLQLDDTYEQPTVEDDQYLKNIYENDDVTVEINLSEVNDVLQEDEQELSQPPINLNIKELLRSCTSNGAPLGTNGHKRNTAIDEMIENDDLQGKLVGFVQFIWHHLYTIMDKHTDDNLAHTIQKIHRQEFTSVTSELHVFFKSQEYKACLFSLFAADRASISDIQTLIGCELVLALYSRFLIVLSDKVRCHQTQELNDFDVWNMSSEGKGKVRYVGGWALRKAMEKARCYVKQNMVSQYQDTLDNVNVCLHKVSLIQDELCVNITSISSTTKYPDTLELTESRQYRERGLLHISDNAFEFFMALEQKRIKLICDENMKTHGSSMVENALTSLKEEEDLKDKWFACFEDDVYLQELREDVFYEVIQRNVNMGANQFLRDFRYQFKVKKTAELRKRVLQRQQKVKEKQDMVKFQDILQDSSIGKTQSHALLTKFIEDHQQQGLIRVYSKKELRLLCKAYRVKFNSKSNKTFLSTMLVDAVRTQQQMPLVTALQQ